MLQEIEELAPGYARATGKSVADSIRTAQLLSDLLESAREDGRNLAQRGKPPLSADGCRTLTRNLFGEGRDNQAVAELLHDHHLAGYGELTGPALLPGSGTCTVSGRKYPILGWIDSPVAGRIPLLDVPMMSDYTWQLKCLQSRLAHRAEYARIEDVDAAIAELTHWLAEHIPE